MHLRHARDAEGRPIAIAVDADSAPFAAFLTEEVHWTAYAETLLSGARAGASAEAATGNAYAVEFADEMVTVEHLHLPDRPPLRLHSADFIAAMTAWRDFLIGNP